MGESTYPQKIIIFIDLVVFGSTIELSRSASGYYQFHLFMKKHIITIIALTLTTPLFAFAQTHLGNISDVGQFIINLINGVFVPVIFALAFIVLLWGLFQAFIIGANDETAKGKGKHLIMYGIGGLVIMLTIWGLVHIITGSFNTQNTGPGKLPTAGVGIGG